MSADAQCYIFCRDYAVKVILFLKRIDNPSIPLSKANIQLSFVNGSLEHGKTGKDRVCCACKCNQVRSIKTPNLVLFLVAVTFNTSRNLFKIRLLKARME